MDGAGHDDANAGTRVEVAGTVQDTNDRNTIVGGSVENEVLSKPLDAKRPKTRTLRMPEGPRPAHMRHLGQLRESTQSRFQNPVRRGQVVAGNVGVDLVQVLLGFQLESLKSPIRCYQVKFLAWLVLRSWGFSRVL